MTCWQHVSPACQLPIRSVVGWLFARLQTHPGHECFKVKAVVRCACRPLMSLITTMRWLLLMRPCSCQYINVNESIILRALEKQRIMHDLKAWPLELFKMRCISSIFTAYLMSICMQTTERYCNCTTCSRDLWLLLRLYSFHACMPAVESRSSQPQSRIIVNELIKSF